MSNAHCPDALLDTLRPVYTPASEALGLELDKGQLNAHELNAATSEITHRGEFFRPTTRDGYTWFWAVPFTVDDGHVVVALPWFQDRDQVDGTNRDRAVAVYVQGEIPADVVESLLNAFTEAITQWRDAQVTQPV